MNQSRGGTIGRRICGSIAVLGCFLICLSTFTAIAQETTGGLQGTIKDPTGAVVANAGVELTGTSLVGSKKPTRAGTTVSPTCRRGPTRCG
jgi:hypothetical protein